MRPFSVLGAFLGGPLDGQVREVRNGESLVRVPVLAETPALYAYSNPEPIREEFVRTRTVDYVRHDVSLFGKRVTTYVPTGVRSSERDALAREAFLSPLAKGLIS